MESFFEKVPYVRYEGPKSRNPFAFRFYNPDEVLAGKPMREHLRFAMSYWHTLGQEGRDPFGDGTTDKTFGGVEPMEISRRRAFAAFELMDKLSLDYFCFHDRDLAPEGKTLAETNARLDEIADLLERLMKEHGKRLLWGTANLFTNPRYLHGAATSCNADVFAFAAAQVKKALDLTCRLHGDGFVFWGGREGYETLLNTDMGLELDNYACFLRMAADYAQSIGFTGGLYLEPKPKEPCKHQYDFDASTVLAFLRRYGLADRFRLNIEANHATLAGHTFQHELRVARLNGALGSLDINEGDPNLGWDTDKFPSNVYDATFCLYEILEMGGLKKGGLNFDAKTRRPSFTREDIALSYIAGMDTFALGLRAALRLREDGRLQEFIRTRYRSYESGVGLEIRSGRATLESLAQYALVKGKVEQMQSGRQEYLEGIVNQILFGSALC